MSFLGKLISTPVRIINTPLRVVEHLVEDEETDPERTISSPLEDLADAVEKSVDEVVED